MRRVWHAPVSVLLLIAASLTIVVAAPPQATAAPNDGLIYQFQRNIFLTTESGAGETNLTPGSVICCAEPSPDGTKIAFQVDTSTKRIGVMNADGSGVVDLGVGFGPIWSADGSKLYVREFVDNGWREFELDIATGNRVEIARRIVRWNNAGTEYLFTTGGNLYVSNAPVTTEPDVARSLIAANSDGGWWNPNDSRIVYRTVDGALHTVDRTGSNRNMLVASTGGGNTPYADWSPDGSRIAYVDADLVNIYTIKPDGTDRRIIRSGFGFNVPRFLGPARPGADPCAGNDPDPACDQPPVTIIAARSGTASIRGTNANDVFLLCQELGDDGPVPGSYYLRAQSPQFPRQEVQHLTGITADILFVLRGGDNTVEVGPPCEPLEPGVEPTFGEGVTTLPRNVRFLTTTGNDNLSMRQVDVLGDLIASTSRGNDGIALEDVMIGDDLTVQMSVGSDDFAATNLNVVDRALINLSNDFNTLLVQSSSFGRVNIRGGNVFDDISLLETVLGISPVITTGGLGDRVVYTPGRAVDPWTRTFTINTGSGNDGVTINPGAIAIQSRGALNLNTGAGNDAAELLIPLGPTVGRDRLNGSSGEDTLSIISSTTLASIRGFETVLEGECLGCPE